MQVNSVILMYHRIASVDIDPWGMCVSEENFSEHLEVLRERGNPIPLSDMVAAHQTGSLPDRAIALTFDDGYVDNFTTAFPLLTEKSVPATIYMTSCHIDSESNFWWDQLESIFLRPSRLPSRLSLKAGSQHFEWDLREATEYSPEQFELDRETIAWTANPGTRMALFYEVWKTLWPLQPQQRDFALEYLKQWAGIEATSCTSRRCVNSRELRTLGESSWIDIGAHSSHHSLLPAHSEGWQRAEIRDCKDRLEKVLRKTVTSFAYPYGEYTDETIQIVRESGFESAVTVQPRPLHTGFDPMRLPRYGIKNVRGEQLALQLDAWLNQAGTA